MKMKLGWFLVSFECVVLFFVYIFKKMILFRKVIGYLVSFKLGIVYRRMGDC